ncbi:rhamnogalacturonate lyase-like [Anthonomus grandis grandis]|uniref:rhamnogalacturonate lyase-like n=1 Tax=Anthonomus grandis grandis TaxID=2921223 RepID=UPI00216614A0|nr:rhamnogalacturonate lyase-like [Anthonomus grandis grandis]
MNLKIFLTVLVSLGYASDALASVTLTVSGLKANIKNSLVELDFKADSTISAVKVGGKNIASTSERSFYLDWNNNGQGVFKPSSIHIVEQTSSRVHFYWLQENIDNVFRIELHYIMVDGVSGIYSYAKYTNDKSSDLTLGETRVVYRFNPSILTQGSNQARTGTLYTSTYLNKQTKIQDETWQLPDGTYYTKYDYAGYLRETDYQGVYGNGYGAFVISPSREYHGGGPLKQDLLIHQNSLIANYFISSHFGTAGLTAPSGWSHIYGPWLLYFNTGSDSAILSDVVNRVATEKKSWPYSFVNDSDYPLSRGSVSGTVSGQKSAMVVLWDDTTKTFEQQSLGHLYNTKTNSDGSFSIANIRPGSYLVAAYPLAGHGSDNLATSSVTVTAGGTANVGTLSLPEPSNIIWSIGETDRRSDQYKYSNEPRNYVYETLPPESLTFTIGSSSISEDWYYAQSKPGVWTVQYQDTQDGNGRTLRVALAAASVKPHLIVYLNNHKIGDVYFGNDQAVYRSAMQSGTFTSLVLTANNAQVVSGTNTLTFQISRGMVMYDTISLQRG